MFFLFLYSIAAMDVVGSNETLVKVEQRDGGQAAMVPMHVRHVSDIGLGSSSPTRIGMCRSLVILANLGRMRRLLSDWNMFLIALKFFNFYKLGRQWCFQMLLSDWADNGATVIGEMECWWYLKGQMKGSYKTILCRQVDQPGMIWYELRDLFGMYMIDLTSYGPNHVALAAITIFKI
ncbi:hypothetical protein Hdeb2414_s0064g00765481 [Helianthus debilis subsp. tardiflorus]